MREKDVEIRLKNGIKALGGMCLKFPPIFVAGFPDRICLLHGGRCVFVELKKPNEKPRKLQLYVHEQLRALGFCVVVLDNVQAVDAFVSSLA